MPKLDPDAQTERTIRPLIRDETSLPIYWLNEEWAVTRFGLESVCEGSYYPIPKERLDEWRGNRADWPAQLEEKGWTDPRLFVEAFFKALDIHEVAHTFDLRQEQALANDAADEIVARREAMKRLAERKPEKRGVYSMSDFADEDEIEAIKAEGFRAPEFPRSCIQRGLNDPD